MRQENFYINRIVENGVFDIKRSPSDFYQRCNEISECSICLSDIEEEEMVPTIPCGHKFHIHCLTKWKEEKNTCPYCRSDLSSNYLKLCIGEFIFSVDYTYECFIEDLKNNAFVQSREEVKIENDQQLMSLMAYRCWDEQLNGAIYRLPQQFYAILSPMKDYMEAQILETLLLRAGIESNPGPVQSRPLFIRNNDPRIVKLEKALERKEAKVRTLIRAIERLSKRPVAQGMFGDLKTILNKAAQIPDNADIGDLTGNISKITAFVKVFCQH